MSTKHDRTDYVRMPRVGDVISYRTGPALVTAVRLHGLALSVVDGLGRHWDAERAVTGTWVRLHRQASHAVLMSHGLAPLPSRPAARERVHTWANGFGTWHARVTFPIPGYGPQFLAMETDRIRNKARRAIRREIVAREGGPVAPTRVKLVDTRTDSLGRIWAVTYAEDVR